MATNPNLSELRETLRERLEIVGDRALFESDPAAHLDKLKAASLRLEKLVVLLESELDPRLAHYLTRQSYVKALDWLDAHTA